MKKFNEWLVEIENLNESVNVSPDMVKIFKVITQNRSYMGGMPTLGDVKRHWENQAREISKKAGVDFDIYAHQRGGGGNQAKISKELDLLIARYGQFETIEHMVGGAFKSTQLGVY